MMVGNWAQSILHGGLAPDVAAGLCVEVLNPPRNHQEDTTAAIADRFIDLRVDYLRPGRGERFIATSIRYVQAIKSLSPALNCHNGIIYIGATATHMVG